MHGPITPLAPPPACTENRGWGRSLQVGAKLREEFVCNGKPQSMVEFIRKVSQLNPKKRNCCSAIRIPPCDTAAAAACTQLGELGLPLAQTVCLSVCPRDRSQKQTGAGVTSPLSLSLMHMWSQLWAELRIMHNTRSIGIVAYYP